jgi:hypothetical protein
MCTLTAVGLPEGDRGGARSLSRSVFESMEAVQAGIRARDQDTALAALQRTLGGSLMLSHIAQQAICLGSLSQWNHSWGDCWCWPKNELLFEPTGLGTLMTICGVGRQRVWRSSRARSSEPPRAHADEQAGDGATPDSCLVDCVVEPPRKSYASSTLSEEPGCCRFAPPP